MKRNERITSSWGFLAQGTKAALCLLVLMLSVQAVFAQKDPKQFVYNGFTYLYNGDGTVAFTGMPRSPCRMLLQSGSFSNQLMNLAASSFCWLS